MVAGAIQLQSVWGSSGVVAGIVVVNELLELTELEMIQQKKLCD